MYPPFAAHRTMPVPARFLSASAALGGGTGVIAGALGAHALRLRLAAAGFLPAWQTAVQYHLLHSVALLVIAFHLPRAPAGLRWAAGCWAAGILLFSGSIYALALGAPLWLGPLTPAGGLCLLAGWALTGIALARRQ